MLFSAKVTALYTRGFNPPYNEGYISAARGLVTAMNLAGLRPLVLNYAYGGIAPARHSPSPMSDLYQFEIRIPAIQREALFHLPTPMMTMVSSVLESLTLPRLFIKEIGNRCAAVHLLNCFVLPRILLRILSRTPLLIHIYQRGYPLTSLKSRMGRASAFCASSETIASELRSRAHGRPIFILPPVVDANYFASQSGHKRKKVGLYLGSLAQSRFPDKLLEAIRDVITFDPEVSFRVIAPINLVNVERCFQMRLKCKELGISHRVAISLQNLSERGKIRQYSAAKFLLFAPETDLDGKSIEPPLTVLEAAASGLPIVATDTYSARDVIASGKGGFIVDRADYGRISQRVIDVVSADDGKWSRLSSAARNSAAKFSVQAAAVRLIGLNEELS